MTFSKVVEHLVTETILLANQLLVAAIGPYDLGLLIQHGQYPWKTVQDCLLLRRLSLELLLHFSLLSQIKKGGNKAQHLSLFSFNDGLMKTHRTF